MVAGGDLDKEGLGEWTPLHDAACTWNPEIARETLRRDPCPNTSLYMLL